MKILIVKLTHWCNLKLHEHVQTWKLIRGEFQWTLSDFLYKSLRMRKMPWRGLIWFVGISGVKFHENSIKGSGAIKETPWWTSLLVSCIKSPKKSNLHNFLWLFSENTQDTIQQNWIPPFTKSESSKLGEMLYFWSTAQVSCKLNSWTLVMKLLEL